MSHERTLRELEVRANYLREQKELKQQQVHARDEARRQAEHRRQQAEREQLAAMTASEDYRADPNRADGIVERYAAATPEHRAIIERQIDALFPCTIGDEYARRPHPDYANMTCFEARLLTLGAFLGLDVERDRFPRLVLDPTDWQQHRYRFKHFGGPAPIAEWQNQLPTIRAYLRAGSTISDGRIGGSSA